MDVNNKRKRDETVIDLTDDERSVGSIEERHKKRVKELEEMKKDTEKKMKKWLKKKGDGCDANSSSVMDEEQQQKAHLESEKKKFISVINNIKTIEELDEMATVCAEVVYGKESPVWYTEWVEEEIEETEDPDKEEKKLYDDRIMSVEVLREALEEAEHCSVFDGDMHQYHYLMANLELFYKPY